MATTAIGMKAARELDELYRAHAAEVYRYVYAVLGNSADAEDVTQTTFVNALRALERGERPRKPTNWLITIAHNLIRQRFRQQQSRPREVELDRELATIESDNDGPSIDDLVRALQRIPPAQREALVLRELEGRSYKEIVAILGVSATALETLIFRARRSLAEELENLVTCDRAELALSQQADGRLGRKERKRLTAHLEECPSCARIAALGKKRRHAFKGLAVLPLPLSLTLFKGAPSASAALGMPALGLPALGLPALGLPALGAGAAAGGGIAGAIGTGVAAKLAIGVAAVAVAGGAGYEGVKRVQEPVKPQPARSAPAVVVPASERSPVVQDQRPKLPPGIIRAKAAQSAPKPAATKPKVERARPSSAATPVRGRSAVAPGQTKTAANSAKTKPATKRKLMPVPKENAPRTPEIPADAPLRGKSATATSRVPPLRAATPSTEAKTKSRSKVRPLVRP
ncbi:MAG: sigma-70 family RNA polymerase sigma factor [Gaiellaceae bacterium]